MIAAKGTLSSAPDLRLAGTLTSPRRQARRLPASGLPCPLPMTSRPPVFRSADQARSPRASSPSSCSRHSGAQFTFDGNLGTTGVSGRVGLRSTDSSPLLAATGVPLSEIPRLVLVLDACIASGADGTRITDIKGRFGAANLSGEIARAPDGKVTGKLETGALALRDVITAAAFLG